MAWAPESNIQFFSLAALISLRVNKLPSEAWWRWEWHAVKLFATDPWVQSTIENFTVVRVVRLCTVYMAVWRLWRVDPISQGRREVHQSKRMVMGGPYGRWRRDRSMLTASSGRGEKSFNQTATRCVTTKRTSLTWSSLNRLSRIETESRWKITNDRERNKKKNNELIELCVEFHKTSGKLRGLSAEQVYTDKIEKFLDQYWPTVRKGNCIPVKLVC